MLARRDSPSFRIEHLDYSSDAEHQTMDPVLVVVVVGHEF
jgi:hypothetical protein